MPFVAGLKIIDIALTLGNERRAIAICGRRRRRRIVLAGLLVY